MIGALGDVVFIASVDVIRTFESLSRSSAGRWAKHEIMNQKPKSEFLGPDLDTINLKMRFDVMYGINPRKEMETLLALAKSGEPVPLVVGGKGLGVNKWVVKSVEQEWKHVDNKGNVLVGIANVTLEEYV